MNFTDFPVFFLASNSAQGFISYFARSYSADSGWQAYLIKGGPGTGKSSLMKQFANKADISGKKVILCPCSSDPSSLDAVILPDEKIVLLDATAPHIVEPEFPAVCEQIINTGAFWNKQKLISNKNSILTLCRKNSALHKKSKQYITAAGQLAQYNFSTALSAVDIDKAMNFANKIATRYFREKKNTKGTEWVRFLSSITPDGVLFWGDTIEKECIQTVVISDEYGAVASIILSVIRDAALNAGYEIITVRNALLPGEIIDHILVPELGIGFCTENREMKICGNSRRIHASRFMNMEELKSRRQKIIFNRKAKSELLECACDTLKEAKQVHDDIEKYYISAMDFSAVNKFVAQFLKDILD